MNKLIGTMLVLLVLLGALAGCAAPEPTKAPPPPAATQVPATSVPAATKPPATAAPAPTTAPVASAPVKIVYWRALSGAPGDAQEEIAKRFNASQKEVQVEVQFQGTYPELQRKLQAALAARTTPDVVMFDSPQMPYFAKNGALAPLDDFAKGADSVDLKNYIPGLLADGYFDGKLYALPFARSTPILYFNRDLFKEVGLPDRAPETWDEFLEFSKKLVKKEGAETKRVGYAVQMGTTTAHWYFQELLYAYGNDVSDDKFKVLIDQPEGVAAAKFLQDMIFVHGAAIPGTGPDGAQGEFTNQRSGMHFGSTGSLVNIISTSKFQVGVGFMPAAKRRQVPIGGSVLAVLSASPKEKQAAAWKFIKYMTNTESNVYFVQKTGYMPISTSAVNSPEMKEFLAKNPAFKIAVEQLQFVRPQASIIAVPEATEIFRQLVEKLTVGKIDPATAMKEASAALTKAYNETFK
ncbi:MAG: ABC transporter substrate-binding protein [Chloroflexi bacterium]|nr:ABC transporter substrate-binding protein [Chloroflexota bacterium]